MNQNAKIFMSTLFILTVFFYSEKNLAAASSDDVEVLNLEDIYNTEQKKQVTQPIESSVPVKIDESASQSSSGAETQSENSSEVLTLEKEPVKVVEDVKVKELKDLNKLVPFSEISIIQRKFMPKTQRFQFFLGAGLATNTPWFTNYGAKLNLGYNFTESFGIEVNTLFLNSTPRQVAKEIEAEHDVKAEQFIYTKGYYGLDLVWSPIYGKMTLNNESIINYEMYFSIGGGQSSTNSLEKNVPTAHLALGQIFAISKSFAFRWDYGFSFFQATPILSSNATTTEVSKNLYNDLVLTAGFSFFFPEVNYR